jgi:uncharacterized protein
MMLDVREGMTLQRVGHLTGRLDRRALPPAVDVVLDPVFSLCVRGVGAEVRIDGHIDVAVHATCDRCLCAFCRRIPMAVALRMAVDRTCTDDDVLIVEERIDLTPYLCEEILLQMPTFFICKDDCAGLCTQCGIDRNVGHCSCHAQAIDERFSALATWTVE